MVGWIGFQILGKAQTIQHQGQHHLEDGKKAGEGKKQGKGRKAGLEGEEKGGPWEKVVFAPH